MSSARTFLRSMGLVLLCLGVRQTASATTFTETGTFGADNQVDNYVFNVASTSTYTLYTTSYGGGANLDGTTSVAGGFVPVLTVFRDSGKVVAGDGGSGTCNGSAMADPVTGMCDDAYLNLTLTAGDYLLTVSEFPNVAKGNLPAGFLFPNAQHETGRVCGQPGGTFLQTDVDPCVQRDGNYAVNVTNASAVPEPPTWALVLPAAGALFFVGRQHLS